MVEPLQQLYFTRSNHVGLPWASTWIFQTTNIIIAIGLSWNVEVGCYNMLTNSSTEIPHKTTNLVIQELHIIWVGYKDDSNIHSIKQDYNLIYSLIFSKDEYNENDQPWCPILLSYKEFWCRYTSILAIRSCQETEYLQFKSAMFLNV